ncbi:DUF6171 family protein [Oceanobacillus bengalensis]|uniref:Uncharacterized protein n=1 Tax=Oceanobacillus bengalensis TaxID=1435466 RepID=A0A494Z121_9BACI|nr:DUF6171 family protein [Oceanobacillus bengalensis]RKQ15676.1 hypothetical protein D8M05_09210 [Oceanobacillus bengalensis]
MSCKGCSRSVIVSDEYIQKQIDEQLQLETDIVDDETYNKRLATCKKCPSLLYGNTCGFCGCFVQFRAKLAYKTCPYPDEEKW